MRTVRVASRVDEFFQSPTSVVQLVTALAVTGEDVRGLAIPRNRVLRSASVLRRERENVK